MDALDILTDLDNVFPYFQPIFSADEHRVIGYEVLGRYKGSDGVVSLGPFFQDENIPEEFRIEVDYEVLKKALGKAQHLDKDILIFINRDADLLMYNDGEQFLNTLQEYEKKGISLDRIVLEITERNYKGDFDHLDHLLNYYRTYGIKLAIDKLGNESSHLDRIGQLAPDILKVDLESMKTNASAYNFNDILYSLSMLARKIGASLLFENIEMVYQLQYAWKNGGRYYQGYYLQKPAESFPDRDILKEKLRNECHRFMVHEKKKLESLYQVTLEFNDKLIDFVNKNKKVSVYEETLEQIALLLDGAAFRLYICDEDGFQKSANYFKRDGGWLTQNEYLHKNWSWRPYFLENIMKMRINKKGILSDLYTDIETGETIRTFSFPLNTNDYLFVDLSYNFLYEQDGLL
ncbi:EAL-associated domain-containing protein [Cytobacillus firmus]|uniref:Putative EAL-domain containing protein YkuI n=2 Tax=Cytobacillus firmus TaxID=1399 RepID=A0A800NB57_CYTFI|nr:EAL domain-containing protein [Cytobacillus firmus]KAF0824349.1 putative EAL-domain containing protein YkuI [Cytobacillus firmus]MBG9545939.1 diguanylate phosphodiesterase [Cytobacillus firmus]MBG9602507.1 diguanylate phosphodiesterase [Cytobacillus firmus]MBG9654207.1 diguanylate phosphodiesterase [Cytobacillus firmus]MED1907025.1 EAL-associated domain-containing protein [Cytobacillus firmus]